MTVLTGADGQLLVGTTAIAKCRDWSLTIVKDAVEDTCLASTDRTYVQGLRGATGSATLLYDPDNLTANRLLNTILLTNDVTEEITFKMNRKGIGGNFVCNGFLTSVSPSISVGDAQAVSISFQINGATSGKF